MDGRQPSLSAPEVSAPQTPDARSLKRRLGVAEELVRIKKECIEENNELYDEEHRNFTKFSKRLEAKWEQRFDALAQLAQDAGVKREDIEAVRSQQLDSTTAAAADTALDMALQQAAALAEADKQAALQQVAARAEADKQAALQEAAARAEADKQAALQEAAARGAADKQTVLQEMAATSKSAEVETGESDASDYAGFEEYELGYDECNVHAAIEDQRAMRQAVTKAADMAQARIDYYRSFEPSRPHAAYRRMASALNASLASSLVSNEGIIEMASSTQGASRESVDSESGAGKLGLWRWPIYLVFVW